VPSDVRAAGRVVSGRARERRRRRRRRRDRERARADLAE
jgi:hypothetical protein